jgi:hypothetical protein
MKDNQRYLMQPITSTVISLDLQFDRGVISSLKNPVRVRIAVRSHPVHLCQAIG